MYPVSKAFLQAVQENTRHYYWTGRITTVAGAVYDFSQEDIVKGSGYISGQCCGSSEIELGTVYAAEMGISLYLPVDRYTLEDAQTELFYHLRLGDGSYEEVPMGVPEFDGDLFKENVEGIFVPEDNKLVYQFYDGHTVTKTWIRPRKGPRKSRKGAGA